MLINTDTHECLINLKQQVLTANKHKRQEVQGHRLKLLAASNTFFYFASAQKHLYLLKKAWHE